MTSALYDYPNLYFAAVPIAAFFAAVPHWYTIRMAMKYKSDPPFDIGNPRRWVAGLQYRLAKGEKLKPFEHTVLQGQAAQQNGFEHLPMLAAALILGKVAHLPTSTMNNVALFYLITRVIYVYLYLAIPTGFKALWRTLVFNSGYLSLVYVFFAASLRKW